VIRKGKILARCVECGGKAIADGKGSAVAIRHHLNCSIIPAPHIHRVMLKAISDLGYPATISDISVKSGYSFSSVSGALNFLLGESLVFRTTEGDGKSSRWTISVTGKVALDG